MEINLNAEGFREINDMNQEPIGESMSVIFGAMTLAAGVAVAAMSCLESPDVPGHRSCLPCVADCVCC